MESKLPPHTGYELRAQDRRDQFLRQLNVLGREAAGKKIAKLAGAEIWIFGGKIAQKNPESGIISSIPEKNRKNVRKLVAKMVKMDFDFL